MGNLLKAGSSRGSIFPPAPARGFEPRGQRMKHCFVFSRDRCSISFPNFVHDLFFRWVRTPVYQVAHLKWTTDGILNYSLGPRRFFLNDIQGGKAVFKTSSHLSPRLSPSPRTASVTLAVSPIPPARHHVCKGLFCSCHRVTDV